MKCSLCDKHIEEERAESVSCKNCNTQYHIKCVVVNDNVLVWTCMKCPISEGGNQSIPPTAPKSVRARSLRSDTSQMDVALQLLDEQNRILREQFAEKEQLLKEKETSMIERHKRQNKLLAEKLQLVKALSSGSGSKSSSRSSKSMGSKEKVLSWMQSMDNGDNQENPNSNEVEKTDQLNSVNPRISFNEPAVGQLPVVYNPGNHVQNHLGPFRTSSTFQQPETYIHDVRQPVSCGDVTRIFNNVPLTNPASCNNDVTQPIIPTGSGLSKAQIAARHVVKGLPPFDGSPDKWSLFFSSYNRSTNICGFSNAENLERLTSSLKGSALDAVRNCLTLEDNVPRVIETLKMLFGRPDFIINDLLEKLRKDSRPKFDNIESIIKYSLQVENITDTMRAGGLSEYLWNPQLLQEMIDRLPTMLKMDWANLKPNRACSIEEFNAWLSERATKYSTILTRAPVFTKVGDSLTKRGFLNIHQSTKCFACSSQCSNLSSCEVFIKMTTREKWNIIQTKKLCRTCLKPHASRRCRLNKLCGFEGCTKRHHELLHQISDPQAREVDEPANDEGVNIHRDDNQILYKILPITLYGNNKRVDTFAMLDDGSSLTLMEDDLVDELNLTGKVESLCLRWTGDIKRVESTSRRVSLQISGFDNKKSKFNLNARTVESLDLPTQTVDMNILGTKYPHLNNVPVASYASAKPRILIGIDYPKLTLISQYKYGSDHEPVAGRCKIGWMVFGAQSHQSASLYHINKCSCNIENTSYFDDLIKHYYTLESIGISSPSKLPMSADDERAMQVIRNTTKYIGNRFEIGLLWKYDNLQVPPSYDMALRRLKCLEKQCLKKPDLRATPMNK